MVDGTDAKTKLIHGLITYAVSAAFSLGVLFAGLRLLDHTTDREASKKSLEHRKQLSKRLGRPLVHATPYEDVIACDVVNPDHIGVDFESIGGLDGIKEKLFQLVILPLRRPELFAHGKLLGPQKGVLLYGPPGTGKTMLAKAIAKECGAVFINVRISNLMSKWFGDAQKLENARVMVLAATNRPSDLDEAILRRLPQAFEIGKPDRGDRAKILKVILKDERVDDNIDFDHIAAFCEGYTGSDILELCKQAAYIPLRDFLQNEKDGKQLQFTLSQAPRPLSQSDLARKFFASRKATISMNELCGVGSSVSSRHDDYEVLC